MRNLICKSLLFLIAGTTFGCIQRGGTNRTDSSSTQIVKTTDTNTCVMQSGGIGVLKLTSPTDTKCVTKDGSLHFNGPVVYDEVEIWLARGSKTVDEALGSVGSQIADEFKDFKPDQTSDVTIAGLPAKQLIGPGHEADDGDAGAAEVIVFKVGDHMFVACTHGESLEPLAQQWMSVLLKTATVP